MSLRDITKDKHTEAEKTAFMKMVFAGRMPVDVWKDYTYNKMLWYAAIEAKAHAEGILNDLPGIDRAYLLYKDWKALDAGQVIKDESFYVRNQTKEYVQYILDLEPGLVIGHLYTWHMGDLFGGQMIKNKIKFEDSNKQAFPHYSLQFNNPEDLKAKIYAKLDDSAGPEAIKAFEFAIKIMNEYVVDNLDPR